MDSRTTPRVFVTQYSKNLKFGEADNYGEVIFLTDQEYKPEPSMPGSNGRVTMEIAKAMIDYIPGTDYVVVTGSALPNVVVGMIIGDMANKSHKILKWDNRNNKYEMFILKS